MNRSDKSADEFILQSATDNVRRPMNEPTKLDQEILQELTNIAEQKQRLECDGLTRVASYILTSERIEHRTMAGSLYQPDSKQVVEPHFWIEIDDCILDFRARMWLGEADTVPNGLFDPESYPSIYMGDEMDMTINDSLFSILMSVG